MKRLTDRQRQVLDYVRDYIEAHGFPPSRPEIAKGLGLTHVSTVDWHLMALMKKGWIEMRPDIQRGLRLLREDVPVIALSRVTAGEPINDEAGMVRRMPKAVARQFSPRPTISLRSRGIA